MPFTVAQSVTPGSAGYPGVAAAQDADLLSRIKRPDWSVVNRVPAKDKAGKDIPGVTTINIAGPNGQSDSVQVDDHDQLTDGGGPQNTPTKETKPAAVAPTKVSPGQGVQNPDGSYTVPVPLAPKEPAAARIDSPAETQTAASGAQNANTASQNATNTAQHDRATEANASALAGLQASAQAATAARDSAQIVYNNKIADIDKAYKDGTIKIDQMQAETAQAHQVASDAVAASNEANRRWADEQTAQHNATVDTETARANAATEAARGVTAQETQRSNQANEANNAATLLQRQQSDNQASLDRGAATGAGLLQQRSTEATSILNNYNQGMASNKNFGLGGALPADFGQNLTQGSMQQATNSMGGQSVMDQAAAAVHAANPALTGTTQGAGATAVMAQMMEKAQPGLKTADPSTANSNTASQIANPQTDNGAAAGQAGALSPSDPRYLGSVIGAAIQHITSNGSPGSRGDTDSFTAPGQGPTV